MAWIEFHGAKVKRLQKFWDLSDLMKWSVNETLGFLGALWSEVIEIREDGDLTGWRPAYIAKLTDATGDPEALVAALIKTQWLEVREGRTLIHDWIDFGGRHLRGKYGAGKKSENIERLRQIWNLHGRGYGKESTGRAPGELRGRLPTEPTIPTEPTEPTGSEAEASGSEGDQGRKGEHWDGAVRLSAILRARILANDPKARIPGDLKKWEDEAERILRLDKRDLDEAERIIIWALADSFWKSNILSMGKFRKQYTALLLRSKGENGTRNITGGATPRAGKYSRLQG